MKPLDAVNMLPTCITGLDVCCKGSVVAMHRYCKEITVRDDSNEPGFQRRALPRPGSRRVTTQQPVHPPLWAVLAFLHIRRQERAEGWRPLVSRSKWRSRLGGRIRVPKQRLHLLFQRLPPLTQNTSGGLSDAVGHKIQRQRKAPAKLGPVI